MEPVKRLGVLLAPQSNQRGIETAIPSVHRRGGFASPQSNQRGIETLIPALINWLQRIRPQSNQRGIETMDVAARETRYVPQASIEPAWD